jgi:hypothetical protein
MGVGVGVAGGVLSSTLHKGPQDAQQGHVTSASGELPGTDQKERMAEGKAVETGRGAGQDRRKGEPEELATYDKEYPPVNVTLKLLLDFKEAGEEGSIQRAGFERLLVQVRAIMEEEDAEAFCLRCSYLCYIRSAGAKWWLLRPRNGFPVLESQHSTDIQSPSMVKSLAGPVASLGASRGLLWSAQDLSREHHRERRALFLCVRVREGGASTICPSSLHF